jgi:hypothetical protein
MMILARLSKLDLHFPNYYKLKKHIITIMKNDDIDNWLPKTSKKELALAVILSPFICLTFWLWLIVICAIEGK